MVASWEQGIKEGKQTPGTDPPRPGDTSVSATPHNRQAREISRSRMRESR